ncbi:EAL domain-containing protein [Limosilactobacillus sp. STM2_1]|uniref:EAL domain-containing protein n=1 Tax=Limosilactobacillus rudii TaxID=2759755 RepID=A0A7W3UL19_9LACO|nr:EAL domain-containing protein [Limosilactobacillus rudii]MBB1079512.1 EAL domain-containing protein [Limosilactobacillus rudii]MBB1097558.1 EAL domain-containing protein [Limosilactobacillus rudii]MCD7134667.1 EAL domain-containing protein [Limosilactobacillus rudii]
MRKIKISGDKLHNIFQPILRVDRKLNAEINAYEMLIRDSSGAFPGAAFFNQLATQEGNKRWIAMSQESLTAVLEKHPQRKIYINLEPCQMEFQETWKFLSEVYQRYGSQVAIEITERRETVHSLDYLDDEIQRLKQLGFELAIDDVCAGSNSYAFIVRQLGVIQRIKLSLLVFKDEDQETKREFINAWLAFATHHHLDFVVEGIASKQLAEEFAGNSTILQQGFYWGKGSAEI